MLIRSKNTFTATSRFVFDRTAGAIQSLAKLTHKINPHDGIFFVLIYVYFNCGKLYLT